MIRLTKKDQDFFGLLLGLFGGLGAGVGGSGQKDEDDGKINYLCGNKAIFKAKADDKRFKSQKTRKQAR